MAIKAILFGSIGTIVETSNIQRNCFNLAFKISGLKWHWSKVLYQSMLKKSGGEKRVKKFIPINSKNKKLKSKTLRK